MAIEALTQREAAERLGISATTLRRRTKEGSAPRNEDGSYPWPHVRDALGGEALTQTELALRLEVSTAWVRELTHRGVLSRNPDGSYPWPTAKEEHEAFQEDGESERAAGFGDESYEKARARKVAAQARAAELDVLEREGRLVSLDDVEPLLREPLERVNAVLKNAPSRYGPRLAKAAGIPLAQAKSVLSDVIETIRTELREVPDHAA